MRRRALLLLAPAALLPGCGFQPVYMPTASGQAGVAQRELAAVSVDIIGDRPGQVLREELQRRLRDDGGTAQRYALNVGYGYSGEGIAVEQDNTATRTRVVGTANWTLRALDPARTLLIGGSARAYDAFNILDSQYFAADLENEAAQRRVANQLADQITAQLAAYFHKRNPPVASAG